MVVAALWALSAAAAEPPTSPQGGTPADPKEQARKLLVRAVEHYDNAEFDKAIDLFQETYALMPAPGILFNIAQAYRIKGRGHCTRASEYYRRFLDEGGLGPNRAVAEQRIAELKECADEERSRARDGLAAKPTAPAEPASVPAGPTPEVQQASPRKPLWPLAVGGVGLAAAGVGVALYATAASDWNRLSSTCGATRTCSATDTAGPAAREQAGVGLLVGGGVVTAAAVVLLLALPAAPVRVGVWAGPQSAALVLEGGF